MRGTDTLALVCSYSLIYSRTELTAPAISCNSFSCFDYLTTFALSRAKKYADVAERLEWNDRVAKLNGLMTRAKLFLSFRLLMRSGWPDGLFRIVTPSRAVGLSVWSDLPCTLNSFRLLRSPAKVRSVCISPLPLSILGPRVCLLKRDTEGLFARDRSECFRVRRGDSCIGLRTSAVIMPSSRVGDIDSFLRRYLVTDSRPL